MIQVAGGGNDRDPAGDLRSQLRKPVRAAHVAGKQGHRIAAEFVHRNHCRVCIFIHYIRGDAAHCDSRGAHKDQGIRLPERLSDCLAEAGAALRRSIRRGLFPACQKTFRPGILPACQKTFRPGILPACPKTFRPGTLPVPLQNRRVPKLPESIAKLLREALTPVRK